MKEILNQIKKDLKISALKLDEYIQSTKDFGYTEDAVENINEAIDNALR